MREREREREREMRHGELFGYLTILLDACSFSVSRTSGYYREEFHEDDPKMMARDFEFKIS